MPGNTDKCRRAPGSARYILYRQHPIFVWSKGQVSEKVMQEKV